MTGKVDTVDATAQAETNRASPSMDQSSSPMTPYVNSLQNLNDRLASYIESKKILESENSRLKATLKSSKEANDRETVMKKKLYADELAEKNKCLNEVALEKAKLEIEYHQTLVDNDNLRGELSKLRNQLEETQVNLKNEIIARVDSENNIKTLQEHLIFQEQLHNEQLNITRREVDTSDSSELYNQLDDQYNVQLQESLQDLREQFGKEIRANRNEMKSLLESKLKNERNSLFRENKSLSSALELSFVRSDNNFVRIGELEEVNSKLNAQIRNFEMALAGERARSAQSSNELKTLGHEMDLQLKKYHDLMDAKVSLALEVATYKQLLCNGEQGSKIEPGAKRQRNDYESIPSSIHDTVVTSTSSGNIEIVQADSVAKFVKLHNIRENESVSLDGWQLVRRAGGNETAYKFDHFVQVDAGADLVVWSADSGVSVSPGNIMDAQMWIVGDEITFTLVNHNGEEEAKRIEKKFSPGHIQIHEPNGIRQKCYIM